MNQTPDEIKEYREKKMNSPWRDRPIAESLELFDEMKRGMIEEGKATLRMKQDMQSDNFNMYDLIAYRIKASGHHEHIQLLTLRGRNISQSFNFLLSSLLLIHMLGTSGVSIQVTIMLIALWIRLRILHIRYVYYIESLVGTLFMLQSSWWFKRLYFLHVS